MKTPITILIVASMLLTPIIVKDAGLTLTLHSFMSAWLALWILIALVISVSWAFWKILDYLTNPTQ